MCEIMEMVKEDGRIEGFTEGRLEGCVEGEINRARKIAGDMKKKGFEFSFIAELTELSEDEIRAL